MISLLPSPTESPIDQAVNDGYGWVAVQGPARTQASPVGETVIGELCGGGVPGWRRCRPDSLPRRVSVSPPVPSVMAGDVCEAWLSAGWSHSATLSPGPPLLVSPATPPPRGRHDPHALLPFTFRKAPGTEATLLAQRLPPGRQAPGLPNPGLAFLNVSQTL